LKFFFSFVNFLFLKKVKGGLWGALWACKRGQPFDAEGLREEDSDSAYSAQSLHFGDGSDRARIVGGEIRD
jgi:hypothetical protein